MDVVLKHYGLCEQPFGVTPDPRFLLLGPKHREALASLIYGTEADRGFLALIAKPGMGKTSLLSRYLEYLRNRARTAFVFQTDCDSSELLRQILLDFGLNGAGKDLATMREMLNGLLRTEMLAGRRVVVVIDEAQNLRERVLESVRLLSNFEAPGKKLLQIVLAGQPQLADRLAQPSLAQLRQRLSFIVRIEPLTSEETSAYIDHRLECAGYRGTPLFTPEAQRLVARESEGVPRNINNICFNAMSLACASNQKAIGHDIVKEALCDLDLDSLRDTAAATSPLKQGEKRTPTPAPVRGASRFGLRLRPIASAAALFAMLAWPVAQVKERDSQAPRGGASYGHMNPGPSSERVADPTIPRPMKSPTADVVRVMPGQTLYEISLATLGEYDSRVLRQLQQLNPRLSDPNYIQSGVKLIMPIKSAGSSNTVRVSPGQTLYGISVTNLGEYNGTILRELQKLNPWLGDPDYIQSGLKLTLPITNTSKSAHLTVRQGADVAAQRSEAQ